MSTDERQAWMLLVFEANRLGRAGKRVISADVIPPLTASGHCSKLIVTDNGPSTATENW